MLSTLHTAQNHSQSNHSKQTSPPVCNQRRLSGLYRWVTTTIKWPASLTVQAHYSTGHSWLVVELFQPSRYISLFLTALMWQWWQNIETNWKLPIEMWKKPMETLLGGRYIPLRTATKVQELWKLYPVKSGRSHSITGEGVPWIKVWWTV